MIFDSFISCHVIPRLTCGVGLLDSGTKGSSSLPAQMCPDHCPKGIDSRRSLHELVTLPEWLGGESAQFDLSAQRLKVNILVR